nr:cysteine-rich receptor-like protein kinase 29 [Quercus suber]
MRRLLGMFKSIPAPTILGAISFIVVSTVAALWKGSVASFRTCTTLQAWKNWRERTASHIIDPTLRHSSIIEIMRCIHIGLLCVQERVTDRPTMAMIVLMLNSYSITLLVPSQLAFSMHSNFESDISRSDHSNGSYVQHPANEASIIELYPH